MVATNLHVKTLVGEDLAQENKKLVYFWLENEYSYITYKIHCVSSMISFYTAEIGYYRKYWELL